MSEHSRDDLLRRLQALEDPFGFLVALFEHAPVGFQIYGLDGRSLVTNRSFRELFGSEPPPEYSIFEDDIARARGMLADIERAFAGDLVRLPTIWYDPRQLTAVAVTEGRRVAISSTFFPIRDRSGAQTHVAVVIEDQTAKQTALERSQGESAQLRAALAEKRAAQDRLAETELNFRQILDLVPLAIWVRDRRGRLRLANRACAERHKRRPESLQGARLEHLENDPAVVARELAEDREVLATGVARTFPERPRPDSDGTSRVVRCVKVPFLPAGAQEAAVLGLELDLTEVRRAQEELRRSAEIIASSPDAILGEDTAGRIVAWNPAAERLFGWAREEILGRSAEVLVPAERSAEMVEIRERLARGLAVESVETRRTTRDGHEIPVSLSIFPVSDAQGASLGSSTIARDVSDRALLEDQLRQSQKMEAIGRLAGGIAHDFNNLLTAILGYSEDLLGRERDEESRASLEEIRDSAVRAAGLTRQLLAFSRRQILQPRAVDLNAHLESLGAMLGRVIGEDIDLRIATAPDLPRISVDPSQLEQVVMNLVVNARDAMPSGGSLTLETRSVLLDDHYTREHYGVAPGRYVVLAVSDTGCGMTEEVQRRIFEPFFTTKEAGVGTGLGLSTVFGIVRQSGGQVWVYSEPGRGTTFKIYLPALADDSIHEMQPLPESREPDDAVGEEAVLVVEDESAVRSLIARVLKSRGYRVTTAASPAEALGAIDRLDSPPDLVLSDVVMPGLSGPELARRLRQRNPDLKVLFVSGYSESAVVHHGILEPQVELLSKPFLPDELARRVREVLDRA
ncbi:MAG: PAS domain S-box protein [Thermoanaerobaculia bacterium]